MKYTSHEKEEFASSLVQYMLSLQVVGTFEKDGDDGFYLTKHQINCLVPEYY